MRDGEARPYLRTPAGFERVLKLLGQRTASADPPPSSWIAVMVDGGRARRMFDDLGIRKVAVPNPLEAAPVA